MTKHIDVILMIIATLWGVLLPFVPTVTLHAVTSILGVFALLALLLFTTSFGSLPTVILLFAIALTFVERNNRVFTTHILDPDNSNEYIPFENDTEEQEGDTTKIPFSPSEESTNEEPMGDDAPFLEEDASLLN